MVILYDVSCISLLLLVLYCEATSHVSVKYRVATNGESVKIADVVHNAWKCGDTLHVNETCAIRLEYPRVWQDDTPSLQGRVALVKGSQQLVMSPPQTHISGINASYIMGIPFVMRSGFGMTMHLPSITGNFVVNLASDGPTFHLSIKASKDMNAIKLEYKPFNGMWSSMPSMIWNYPFSESGPNTITVNVTINGEFKLKFNENMSEFFTPGTNITMATHVYVYTDDRLELAGFEFHACPTFTS